MAVMSLSASFLLKISVATDNLCEIALNLKLLWYKFSSCIKTKSCKSRPDCWECRLVLQLWTWHHERRSLICGQNMQRKHTDPVTKHVSAFPSTEHHKLDVQPESQICAQVQPGRTRKKILSHTVELTCPHKTQLHFSPTCF
jgi:hypothetical protein